MSHTITAIFENGVFVPKSKVDLPERTTVKVSIPAAPSRKRKGCALEALFDIAAECTDTDLSVNHDKYLYGGNLP
jgi:predicted DNA-binding antitoxin AbrB/MazE fold protein